MRANSFYTISKVTKGQKVLYTLCLVLSIVFFVVDIRIPLGVAFGVLYLIVVLLTLWLPNRKSTILAGVVCSSLIFAGFCFSKNGGIPWMVVVNRILSILVVWAAAAFVLKLKHKSKTLQESEKQYHTLFQSVTEGLVLTNSRGEIIEVNSRVLEQFGYPKKELIGKPVEVLIPEASRKQHEKYRKTYAEKPKKRMMGIGMDLSGLHKNGNTFPVEVSLNHFNLDGKSMILVLVSDITERMKTTKALKKSEKRYRLLFESMAQGVVYQNAQGEIISANPSAQRILGLSLDQMQGRTSFDPRWKAIHEDGTDFPGETHPAIVALKTGKKVKNIQMGVYHPIDDKTAWININAIPIFKPGREKPYQVYTTFEDITSKKERTEKLMRAESELKQMNVLLEQKVKERTQEVEETQHLYRLIARNFPNGVINVLDRDLNFTFIEGAELYKMGITGDMLM